MLRRLSLALLGALLIGSGLAQAEIYHYVDERGRKVYVDRLSQVPHPYRDQLELRAGSPAGQAEPLEPRALSAGQQLARFRREIDTLLSQVNRSLSLLETPVEISQNRVLVPVRAVYGNRRADTRMLLDTGASNTVFHRASIAPLRGATYAAGQARVASGDTVDLYAINLDRIEIGPFKINATRAMVLDHAGVASHDGLLGMDFLRQVEYRIDYERARIIWDPEQYQRLSAQRDELQRKRGLELEQLLAEQAQAAEAAEKPAGAAAATLRPVEGLE